MNKVMLAILAGVVAVVLFVGVTEAQRGDLYGARAIQSLEQLLNADGVIGDFAPAGDITIAAGFQLLLPDGLVGAPAWAFTSETDTGGYTTGSDIRFAIDGVDEVLFQDNEIVIPGANSTLTFDSSISIMEATSSRIRIFDQTAAGASGQVVTVDGTFLAMNGTDTIRGLRVDVTNANHSGVGNTLNLIGIDTVIGDPNSNLNGLLVEALTSSTGAAGEIEAAVHLDASWDYALFVDGTTQDITDGLTTTAMFSPTLAANDNASDQRNVITIDVDIPDGSAGLINGINIDGVTDDANTLDSAIFIEGGWDSQITFTDIGRAATANPLTGTVWMFLTDTTDYDGGAADCAIVFRDSAGNEAAYLVVASNVACP